MSKTITPSAVEAKVKAIEEKFSELETKRQANVESIKQLQQSNAAIFEEEVRLQGESRGLRALLEPDDPGKVESIN